MRSRFQWCLLIISMVLFFLSVLYYTLSPLYLKLTDKIRLIKRLSMTLQQRHDQPPHVIAEKPYDHSGKLIPFYTIEWFSEITKLLTKLNIRIDKIENAPHDKNADTSRWNVILSGNAHTLYIFFQTLYVDFPALSIDDLLFTLNNQKITASFQLIALLHKPILLKSSTVPRASEKIFPFCQSPQQYIMQAHGTAGIIQYRKNHTTLTHQDLEHVSLSMRTIHA